MKKLYSFLVILFAVSCGSDDSVKVVDLGYDFYPVNTIYERVYEVMEISYDLFGPDTTHYQLREFASDSILSDFDATTYVLSRETRLDETSDWELDSLWSLRLHPNYLVIVENNVPFVKLSFPVAEGRSWNGNAFNTRSSVNYSYEELSEWISDSQIIPNELIKVVIADVPANLVSQDQRFEVYSKGLGLIEKNYITRSFCTVNCDSVGQVQSGRILYQYLIDYVEK
ncbi:MAG: hypothetical protein JXR03_12905 [Cyclobacteriaceae bacterium]